MERRIRIAGRTKGTPLSIRTSKLSPKTCLPYLPYPNPSPPIPNLFLLTAPTLPKPLPPPSPSLIGAGPFPYWRKSLSSSAQVTPLFGAGVIFPNRPAPQNRLPPAPLAPVPTLFPHLRQQYPPPAPKTNTTCATRLGYSQGSGCTGGIRLSANQRAGGNGRARRDDGVCSSAS